MRAATINQKHTEPYAHIHSFNHSQKKQRHSDKKRQTNKLKTKHCLKYTLIVTERIKQQNDAKNLFIKILKCKQNKNVIYYRDKKKHRNNETMKVSEDGVKHKHEKNKLYVFMSEY